MLNCCHISTPLNASDCGFAQNVLACGCSASRDHLFRLARRLVRRLFVFFDVLGSKIVGQQPEQAFLRPEIEASMSVFLKRTEQIVGSKRVLNILSPYVQKNVPLLRFYGAQRKLKIT